MTADRPRGVTYERTQTGWIALVGLAALPVAWLDADPTNLPLLSEAAVRILGTVVILSATVIFSRLTVRVGGGELSWHFGLGMLAGSVRLAHVRRADVVRNPVWFGWGLRLTPVGRVFSVGGQKAVEIETVDGDCFRIGTDEPVELRDAIERAGGESPVGAGRSEG